MKTHLNVEIFAFVLVAISRSTLGMTIDETVNNQSLSCLDTTLSIDSQNNISSPFALLTSNETCGSNIPTSEYLALREFYFTSNGLYWDWKQQALGTRKPWNFDSNFNTSAYPNPCMEKWEGIICTSNASRHLAFPQCNIYGIFLPYSNISGPLRLNVGAFLSLTVLALPNNFITGILPPLLFQKQTLKLLSLANNSFSGHLCPCLGNLTELVYLDVSHNFITNSIPSSIGALTALRQLWLYNNMLSGTLPTTFPLLSNLEDLDIASNNLMGTISSMLGKLSNLFNMQLNSNIFHGTIPTELSEISTLKYLYLYSNQLSGTLASSFGALSSLSYLLLQENSLSGTIPSELGSLSRLNSLYLFSNNFIGSLPKSFSQLTSMSNFLIQSNSFTGTLDGIFRSQKCLLYAALSDNKFSGSIPVDLFLLPNISTISLSKNGFHGSLPADVCNSSASIKALSLDGLSASSQRSIFPGTIFPAFTVPYMEGTIPSCMFQLPNIENLTLDGNGFDGSLPEFSVGFTVAQGLQIVSLAFNRLKGVIPVAMQEFGRFTQLNLAHNMLSGTCDQMGNFFSNHNCSGYTSGSGYASTSAGVADSSSSSGSDSGGTGETCTPQLVLANNRLSGPFPSSFLNAPNINILTGNMFDCASAAELPKNDPAVSTSQCGSSTLSLSLLAYCTSIAAIAAVLWVVSYSPTSASNTLPSITSDESRIADNELYVYLSKTLSMIRTEIEAFRRHVAACSDLLADLCRKDRDKHVDTHAFAVTFLSEMRMLSTAFMVIIVVIYTPYVIAVKCSVLSSRVVTYQYWWLTSVALMEGDASWKGLVAIFLVVMSIVAFSFLRSSQRMQASEEGTNIPVPPFFLRMKTWCLSFQGVPWSRWRSHFFLCLVVYIAVPIGDMMVMIPLNGLYLYLQLTKSRLTSIIFGAFLALIKIIWNTVFLSTVLKKLFAWFRGNTDFHEMHETGKVILQTLLVLMNNVLAPNIANMIVDPNCFFSIITSPELVTRAVSFPICTFINGVTSTCLVFETVTTYTTFQPPFMYSYQCSSSLLLSYTPIFIAMFSYMTFLYPAMHVIVPRLTKWYAINQDPSAHFIEYDGPRVGSCNCHSVETRHEASATGCSGRWKKRSNGIDCEAGVDSFPCHGESEDDGSAHRRKIDRSDGNSASDADEIEIDVEVDVGVPDATCSACQHHLPTKKPIEQDGSFDCKEHIEQHHQTASTSDSRGKRKNDGKHAPLASMYSFLLHRLFKLIPAIYQPVTYVSSTLKPDTSLFSSGNIAANLISNLVVQITFGAVYPPLAVITWLAIMVDTYHWQGLIGKFLMDLQRQGQRQGQASQGEESLAGETASAAESQKNGECGGETRSEQLYDESSLCGQKLVLDRGEEEQKEPEISEVQAGHAAFTAKVFSMLESDAKGIRKVFDYSFGMPFVALFIFSGFTAFFLSDMIGRASQSSLAISLGVFVSPIVFRLTRFSLFRWVLRRLRIWRNGRGLSKEQVASVSDTGGREDGEEDGRGLRLGSTAVRVDPSNPDCQWTMNPITRTVTVDSLASHRRRNSNPETIEADDDISSDFGISLSSLGSSISNYVVATKSASEVR